MTDEVKQTKPRAKRKLSDITFEADNAHVAVVTKTQNGPANGHADPLVLKGANYSKEFVEKAQQVRVTMELPEFLRKFFYLYGEDADVLARMMGYVKPEDDSENDSEDDSEEVDYEQEYEDYLNKKLESFEIIKALKTSDNLIKSISELKEDEYLKVLKDQSLIEKAMLTNLDVVMKSAKEQVEGVSASDNKKVTKKSKDKKIMDENKVNESVVADLQKALDDQKAELQKALDLVKALESEKKDTAAKARKEKIVAVVKDPAKSEVLFKAVKDTTDEDFEQVVKTLGELMQVVEKSELFKETGVDGSEVDVAKAAKKEDESPVAKVLKAKYKKQ